MTTRQKAIEAMAIRREPDVFSDDHETAHRAASPMRVSVVRERCLSEAAKDLDAALGVMGWRPIETLPPERGTYLITGGTYEADGSLHGEQPMTWAGMASYTSGNELWQGDACHAHDDWIWHKPKYWQPMPDLPEAMLNEMKGQS